MNKPLIYLAGDLLNRGSQLQRAEEKEVLESLGLPLYVPQDNKDINDKGNLDSNDALAERIVAADTKGIQEAEIIVMEAREGALGTCIELGQLKGQRDFARMILRELEGWQGGLANIFRGICQDELNKKVYVHNSDIRRQGNPTETGDRRSYGPHQYMYGVVKDVTNGEGYLEFDEIINRLKEL